jgi:hypothetical protein
LTGGATLSRFCELHATCVARFLMFLSSDQNTERRALIWQRFAEPLFDLVCDEHTLESDYQRIGRAAIESGYTDKELSAIYWYEVFPAIAGSWIAIDPAKPDWLENRIRHRPFVGLLLTLFFCPWWFWIGWDCWREIKKGIEIERRHGETETDKEIIVPLGDIGNDK